MEDKLKIGTSASCSPLVVTIGGTVTLGNFDWMWTKPSLIDVIEKEDSLEMTYKQQATIVHGYGNPEERVFKIIYSCVDGKWNKSDRIYGKIIPAKEETYEFE